MRNSAKLVELGAQMLLSQLPASALATDKYQPMSRGRSPPQPGHLLSWIFEGLEEYMAAEESRRKPGR